MGVALILRIFYPGNWFSWLCRHPDKPMDDGIQSGSLTALTSFSADANWSRTSPSCRRRLSAVVVSSQICVLLDWISQRACSTSHFSWCTLHSSSLYYTHTHLTALCPGLPRWAGTNLDFTEARDSEWQWHQLGHMQVCTSLQTDNHASTPPLCFFTGRMPFLPRNQQRQSTEGTHTLLPLLYPFNGLFSRTTLALLQSCILSTFVLVNEYECVDPVHPLHGNTSNFPTVSLD